MERPVRAFFAVELSDAAQREAARVADWLRDRPGGRDVRWVRPESLHVTLRFLGNVAAGRVASLVQAVGGPLRELPAFELRLGRVHGFPATRRPRVVALSLEPEAPLAALADRIERGVVEQGFEPEARGFRAHLTLGRIRGRRSPALENAPEPECSPFTVREVVLFQSHLGAGGARYTPLERLALEGPLATGSESPPSSEPPKE